MQPRKARVSRESQVCPKVNDGKKALDDSYAGVFSRLSTFQAATWFGKPQALSPIECARRGWINEAPDTLQCRLCEGRLFVPYETFSHKSDYQNTLKQTASKLIANHQPKCQWRKKKCRSSTLDFQQFERADLQASFEERLASLKEAEQYLPQLVNWDELQLTEADEKLLIQLGQHLTGKQDKDEVLEAFQQQLKSEFFACMGWMAKNFVQPQSDAQIGDKILWCSWCGAEQGLWQYNNEDLNNLENGAGKHQSNEQQRGVDKFLSLVNTPIVDASMTIAGGKVLSESSENQSFSIGAFVPMTFQYSTPGTGQKRKQPDEVLEKEQVPHLSQDTYYSSNHNLGQGRGQGQGQASQGQGAQQENDQTQDNNNKFPKFNVVGLHQLWCPYMYPYVPSKVIPIGDKEEKEEADIKLRCGWEAVVQSLLPEQKPVKRIQIGSDPELTMEHSFQIIGKHERLIRKNQHLIDQ
eukprot:TRINITY_DN19684_c0_g1_i1.p1 TRINITY_DN19684_c0_g1~~TRINITY_DN19684_c0_g1_i1.p1  ORF type:complete len:490 (-),score=55.22 TRINITY_DN19684_c0_g1_i1:585-1985(-)